MSSEQDSLSLLFYEQMNQKLGRGSVWDFEPRPSETKCCLECAPESPLWLSKSRSLFHILWQNIPPFLKMFSHSNNRGGLFFQGVGPEEGRVSMNISPSHSSKCTVVGNSECNGAWEALTSSRHKAASETAGKGHNSNSINSLFTILQFPTSLQHIKSIRQMVFQYFTNTSKTQKALVS